MTTPASQISDEPVQDEQLRVWGDSEPTGDLAHDRVRSMARELRRLRNEAWSLRAGSRVSEADAALVALVLAVGAVAWPVKS